MAKVPYGLAEQGTGAAGKTLGVFPAAPVLALCVMEYPVVSNPGLMKLAEMICGNAPFDFFPYRSSSDLTGFFIGLDLDYVHDGSTRSLWVTEILKELNAKQSAAPGMPSREMIKVIERLAHPDHFLFDPKVDRPKAIEAVKSCLKSSNLTIAELPNGLVRVCPLPGEFISTAYDTPPTERLLTFRPEIFTVPEKPQNPRLVSVMMPFNAAFRGTYEAVKRVADHMSLECLRADDIWDNATFMQDIFDLIVCSKVVVVDFTGRNLNVDGEVRDNLSSCEWYEVYDSIEAIHRLLVSRDEAEPWNRGESRTEYFAAELNKYFRRQGIGWQLVSGEIQVRGPEAFEAGLKEAQATLSAAGRSTAANEIHQALMDLSKRPESDLTGALQHALAALECVARDVAGDPKATLGAILGRSKTLLPPPMNDAAGKLWGFASEQGRHLREGLDPALEEVELAVHMAATLATYLSRRVSRRVLTHALR